MPKENKTKLMTFRLDPQLFEKIKKISHDQSVPVSEKIRFYVEKGIKNDRKKI